MQTQVQTDQVEVLTVEIPAWIFAALALAVVGLLILILLAFQLRRRRK
jgi:hypothetical protein